MAMMVLPLDDLPGNEHHMNPGLRWKAVRSSRYRASWATVVERRHPQFGDLVAGIPGAMRPVATFGAIGWESQEHSCLWAGDPAVVTRIQDSPGAAGWSEVLASGKLMDRWPLRGPWTELMPATTWNPGGEGIVAEYPLGKASVVVYELLATPAKAPRRGSAAGDGPQPVVTFRCTACHFQDTDDDRYPSEGPYAREKACQAARRHLDRCEGAGPRRHDGICGRRRWRRPCGRVRRPLRHPVPEARRPRRVLVMRGAPRGPHRCRTEPRVNAGCGWAPARGGSGGVPVSGPGAVGVSRHGGP